MSLEEWKQLKEYPGYSVSNWGRVRRDKNGRILRPGPSDIGIEGEAGTVSWFVFNPF